MLGSCGEGSALGIEKKKTVVKYALKYINGRVPLLVGALETSSEKVLEEIKIYENLGAKYFVSAVPYYLEPEDQKGIIKHYQFLTENIKGKLIAYNIPSYVHYDILPPTAFKSIVDKFLTPAFGVECTITALLSGHCPRTIHVCPSSYPISPG